MQELQRKMLDNATKSDYNYHENVTIKRYGFW